MVEEGLSKIVINLEKPILGFSTLERGFVTDVQPNEVGTRTFCEGEERSTGFSRAEFYAGPKVKDLFVYEFDSDDYLVERAIRFGKVNKVKGGLVKSFLDERLKGFEFFYRNEKGEEKEFNPEKLPGNFVLEGEANKGDILVCRRGRVTVGGETKPFAYLAILSKRESYLVDREESVFKKWQNFKES